MKITGIKLTNFCCFPELEVKPGKVTVIEGKNGLGKTAVLEAIKFALGGGSDATIIRKGETEGEVALELDNGMTVTRTMRAGAGGTLKVTDPVLGKVSKGQTLLDRLADVLAVNPFAWLNAKGPEQVAMLAEAIPMEISVAELIASAHRAEDKDFLGRLLAGFAVPKGEHALLTVERARKAVFDERTGVNRAIKEREGTVKQLTEALDPKLLETDWALALAEMRERESEVRRGVDQQKAEHARRKAEAMQAVNEKRDANLAAAKKLRDEAIASTTNLYNDAVERERFDAAAAATGITEKMADELAGQVAAAEDELRGLAGDIAGNKERAEQSARARNTQASIDSVTGLLTADVARKGILETLLLTMDSVRADLLAKVPIKGLELSGGRVLIDGVDLERVNTARRYDIAYEVAELRAGELGIACCDGVEAYDSEHLAAFQQRGLKSKLQLLMSCVTDDEALTFRNVTEQ